MLGAPVVLAVESERVSRVVAKVGDEVITTVELERFLTPWLRKYGKEYDKDELASLTLRAKQAALNQFIERKLLTAEAKELELQIPDVEIEKEMDRIRSEFKTDEDFKAFLDEENLTLEEYRQLVDDDLKAKVLVHEKVVKRVTVLPSEIHDYYQLHVSEFLRPAQVHMYQILIKRKPDSEKALKRTREILADIKAGANFQQMARLHSEGPKRNVGGDWGIVEEGFFGDEMAAVEKAAFKLRPGQASPIIESKYGYHIVYIDRKRISRILTEREAYDEIRQRLFLEKYTGAIEDYMEHLRDKTYVEILDPEVSPAFSFTPRERARAPSLTDEGAE